MIPSAPSVKGRGRFPAMGASMYICLCNGFTDRQVRCHADASCSSVSEVYRRLGCAPQCGKCVPVVREILKGAAALPEAEDAFSL